MAKNRKAIDMGISKSMKAGARDAEKIDVDPGQETMPLPDVYGQRAKTSYPVHQYVTYTKEMLPASS